MKHILLLTLTAAGLFAADASGKWTGNLIMLGDSGSEESRPAHLVLKQDGNKLTGTAGPDAGEQHAIANGKAENGELTFEVPTERATLRFALKQEGDEIKGDITREREGQKQTARLAVKRDK